MRGATWAEEFDSPFAPSPDLAHDRARPLPTHRTLPCWRLFLLQNSSKSLSPLTTLSNSAAFCLQHAKQIAAISCPPQELIQSFFLKTLVARWVGSPPPPPESTQVGISWKGGIPKLTPKSVSSSPPKEWVGGFGVPSLGPKKCLWSHQILWVWRIFLLSGSNGLGEASREREDLSPCSPIRFSVTKAHWDAELQGMTLAVFDPTTDFPPTQKSVISFI